MRPLPELTAESTPFWTGGARGELMIAFCDQCKGAVHPPQLICPACGTASVAPQATARGGTVYSYTVNHQPWLPRMAVPFAIAVVDLDAAPGVRLTAPVVCADPDSIHIGQRMKLGFEQSDEIWLPLWHPDENPV